MNQKENFIAYLTDSTKNDKMIWEYKNTSMPPSVTRVIINPDMVSDVYYSDKQENDIYLIVQKYMRFFPDFEQYYEQFQKFLLVLNGDQLVYRIHEGEVSENMFDILLEEIRGKLETTFYDNFMKNVQT
jgi:hypothetical protein